MPARAKPTPTTFGGWALVILNAVEHRGLDADLIASRAGLDRAALSDPDFRVPQPIMTRLWETIVAESGDPAIGIKLPVQQPVAAFQALGFAIAASDTLEHALRRTVRYEKFVSGAVEVDLTEEGDTLAYVARPCGDDVPPPVAMEAFMSLKIRMFRTLTRDDTFAPAAIGLMRPPPDDPRSFEEFFLAPIEFGQPEMVFLYRADELRRPLPTGNEELAEGNEKLLAQHLEKMKAAPLLDRVALAIESSLEDGAPSKQTVARRLGMSARTLQRHLAESDSGFREIAEDVRCRLAKRYMRDPERSVGEIAFSLGYAQVSAFTRAFRRWTGTTPGEYRAGDRRN